MNEKERLITEAMLKELEEKYGWEFYEKSYYCPHCSWNVEDR